MGHDLTDDDRDVPSTNNTAALRTDGGSEAEQEAPEESEGSDEPDEAADSESESESQSEPESTDESGDSDEPEESDESQAQEGEQTNGGGEGESESKGESEDEGEGEQSQAETEEAEESEEQAETHEEPAQIEADDEAVAEQSGDVGVEPEEDESALSQDGEGDTASIIEVRNQVIELSTDVIGRSLDGIVEVSRNEDNWRAVVEIIERRSVPDTQDILGQYEIELDESGEVIGYRRLEKYRRADTGPSQH